MIRSAKLALSTVIAVSAAAALAQSAAAFAPAGATPLRTSGSVDQGAVRRRARSRSRSPCAIRRLCAHSTRSPATRC